MAAICTIRGTAGFRVVGPAWPFGFGDLSRAAPERISALWTGRSAAGVCQGDACHCVGGLLWLVSQNAAMTSSRVRFLAADTIIMRIKIVITVAKIRNLFGITSGLSIKSSERRAKVLFFAIKKPRSAET